MGQPWFIPSERVNTGRNAEHPAWRDDGYVKCSQCGFMCHLDRDARAPEGSRAGDGITISGEKVYESSDEYNINSVDYNGAYTDGRLSTPPSGCPLCGCLRYDQPTEKRIIGGNN